MLDRFPRLSAVLAIGLILGVIVAERWFFVTRVIPRLPDAFVIPLMVVVGVGIVGIPVLYLIERRRMARGGGPIDLTGSAVFGAAAVVGGSLLYWYWVAGYRVLAIVVGGLALCGLIVWAIRRRRDV